MAISVLPSELSSRAKVPALLSAVGIGVAVSIGLLIVAPMVGPTWWSPLTGAACIAGFGAWLVPYWLIAERVRDAGFELGSPAAFVGSDRLLRSGAPAFALPILAGIAIGLANGLSLVHVPIAGFVAGFIFLAIGRTTIALTPGGLVIVRRHRTVTIPWTGITRIDWAIDNMDPVIVHHDGRKTVLPRINVSTPPFVLGDPVLCGQSAAPCPDRPR